MTCLLVLQDSGTSIQRVRLQGTKKRQRQTFYESAYGEFRGRS